MGAHSSLEVSVRFAVNSLSLSLALSLLAIPAAAQDLATDAPVEACVRVTTAIPIDDLGPLELGQLLIAGEATFEVLEPAACDSSAAPQSEPAAYVEFVAQAAGAAVELAALAERSESAQGLDGLDRAARGLKLWAKRQIRWLDKHPPDACYADVHAQWRRGVVQVRNGAKGVRRSIRTLRPQPMRQAVRDLSGGANDLIDVNLDRVTRACIAAASGT